MRRGLKRVVEAADYLRDLGIGGSAVGTGNVNLTTSGITITGTVAGGNLTAGALANALEAYGFATRHVVPLGPEIGKSSCAVPWLAFTLMFPVTRNPLSMGVPSAASIC